MAGLNGEQIQIVTYDTSRIDFVAPIKAALGLGEDDKLNRLHEEFTLDSIVTRETDSTSALHRRYYENIDNTDFLDRYRAFIHEVVMPLFGEPLIVQRVPSFRLHLPGNKAVGEYHRDLDFGHQAGAINFWLPVTDADGMNTVHIKKDEDGTPTPVNVNFGQVLIFDAVNLLHGNEINTTDNTRISFDLRVIPEGDYIESEELSVNTSSRLAIGDYYVHAHDL